MLLARNCESPYATPVQEAGTWLTPSFTRRRGAAAQAFANDMVATGEYDSIKVRDEADLTHAPDLTDALARLKAFRATWNAGHVIDEGSGLTANDIDVVASFVTKTSSID
jgi:hypothetical protein